MRANKRTTFETEVITRVSVHAPEGDDTVLRLLEWQGTAPLCLPIPGTAGGTSRHWTACYSREHGLRVVAFLRDAKARRSRRS